MRVCVSVQKRETHEAHVYRVEEFILYNIYNGYCVLCVFSIRKKSLRVQLHSQLSYRIEVE